MRSATATTTPLAERLRRAAAGCEDLALREWLERLAADPDAGEIEAGADRPAEVET